MNKSHPLCVNIADAAQVFEQVGGFVEQLDRAVAMVSDALLQGRKLLCCGNGGSAADSAHLTAEIAGRYVIERRGYPAIDLTSNHSLLTALGNDYSADDIFARQVEAMGASGDVLVAISTSGNSTNVLFGLKAAKRAGVSSISLLGRDGGKCKGLADVEFVVPSKVTARIQEAHQLIYHTMCEMLDPVLAKGAVG